MFWGGGGHERVQETGENGFWRNQNQPISHISFRCGCASRKLWWIFSKGNTHVQDSSLSSFAFISRFIAPDEKGAGNQRYISKPYRFYVTSFTRILNKYICIRRKHPSTFDSSDQFYLFGRVLLIFGYRFRFDIFTRIKLTDISKKSKKCFRIKIEDFSFFRRFFHDAKVAKENRLGDESRWLSRWKFPSNNRYPAIRIGECDSGWSVPFDHVRDPIPSLRIEMWQYINCPRVSLL